MAIAEDQEGEDGDVTGEDLATLGRDIGTRDGLENTLARRSGGGIERADTRRFRITLEAEDARRILDRHPVGQVGFVTIAAYFW